MLDEHAAQSAVAQRSEIKRDLDRMAAAALGWIRRNMAYLDPASPAELPTTPKVKGTLELALLRMIWARLWPDDPGLAEATALLRKIWDSPGFAKMVAADPAWYRQYGLSYGALAPPGVTSGYHREVLRDLADRGFLEPRRKSPHLHLECRYYADLAGAGHRFSSYAELYAASILARRMAALPVTMQEAVEITHTIFYISDFGFADPGLAERERERQLRMACELTEYCLRCNEWDTAAEFVLTQYCLGGDPMTSPSGVAGIRLLQRLQRPDGALPGRSADRQAGESATPVEFFRKAYHTTLVTAIVAMIVSAAPRSS